MEAEGKLWEIAWGELRWKERYGSDEKVDGRAVGTGFQDKFHQCDCPEKLCAQDFSKWSANVWRWDMHSFVGRERHA